MGLLDILNGMQNGPRGQTDPNAQGGMSPITMAILALLAYKAYQKMSPGTAAPAPAPGPLPDRRTIDVNLPGSGTPGGAAAGPSGGLADLLGGLLGGASQGRTPAGRTGAPSGGLDDLLGGLLGGLAGGAPQGRIPAGRAAAAPSGGLDDLLKSVLAGGAAGGAAGSVLSGGLGDLLKQFQDNGMGDVADSWVSKGPNKDISTNDLARSIGLDDIDALARQSGLSRDDLLAGLREQLPYLVDQLTPDGRLPTKDEASRWL